jgi:hypothetical protein
MKHALRTAAAVRVYRMLPRDGDESGWLYSVAAGCIPRTGAIEADASGMLAAVRRWMSGTWTSQNMDLLGMFYVEAAPESVMAGTTGGVMLVVRPTGGAANRCPQFIFLAPAEAKPSATTTATAPAGAAAAPHCSLRFYVKFEWTVANDGDSPPPPVPA